MDSLEDILKTFYYGNDTSYSFNVRGDSKRYYNCELEEVILLENSNIGESISIESCEKLNVIYCCLPTYSGKYIHMFFVISYALECWTNIVEKYKIPIQLLISSNKALGDWLDTTKLYHYFLQTSKPELRPNYYFTGRYVWGDHADGMKEVLSNMKYRKTEYGNLVDEDESFMIYSFPWNPQQ